MFYTMYSGEKMVDHSPVASAVKAAASSVAKGVSVSSNKIDKMIDIMNELNQQFGNKKKTDH